MVRSALTGQDGADYTTFPPNCGCRRTRAFRLSGDGWARIWSDITQSNEAEPGNFDVKKTLGSVGIVMPCSMPSMLVLNSRAAYASPR